MALAGALHERRGSRVDARQDPALAYPAVAGRDRERRRRLTNQAPPHEATHWTAPAMAKALGISPSSVRRIWTGQGLQPHRARAFKISNDPKCADKLKDVVGLYVDPLVHAVVLSIDEKIQIQALDRTQPEGEMATDKTDHLWYSHAAPDDPHRRAPWEANVRSEPL